MKKLKILFGFHDEYIGKLCKKYPKDFQIIRKRKENYLNFESDLKFYDYPSFEYHEKLNSIDNNLDKLIKNIIWNEQTLMLYDRDFSGINFGTLSLRSVKITNYILSCISLLKKLNPKFIFFHNMPHQFKSWVFAIIAETLGSKIVYPEFTVIPWRYYLVEGIGNPGKLIAKNNKISKTKDEIATITSLFKLRALNSEKSIPKYASNIKKNYNLRFISDFKKYWNRPDLVLNKYLCYNQYKKLQYNQNPRKKDVVFFLHYQPELSTLPRGYGFAQQFKL